MVARSDGGVKRAANNLRCRLHCYLRKVCSGMDSRLWKNMGRKVALAAALAASAFVGSCKRAPRPQCEQMCSRYSELAFWSERTGNANLTEVERSALRTQAPDAVAELAAKQAAGLEFCISKCMSAGNEGDNQCVIAAQTFDDAKRCTTESR